MPKISRVFLNVDLEVDSRTPLDPLITALGDSVDVLFLGKQGSRYVASVELAGSGWQQKPDPMIRELVERIKALPDSARTSWDNTSERRFDIGCNAPASADAHTLALDPATIAAIAEVNATIAVTVYPNVPPRRR